MATKKMQHLEVSDIAGQKDWRKKDNAITQSFPSGCLQLNKMSYDDAFAALTRGYKPAVKSAEAFMSKIENDLPELPASGGFETILSTHGSRVNRGRWLSGSPKPCYRRVRTQNETAPIKVVVGSFVSCGITAQQYAKRSEAIIAFLMLAQRYRPVELYVSIECSDYNNNDYYALVRLDSKPISLSQVGFVIGHPASPRCWLFNWVCEKWPEVPSQIPAPHASVAEKRTAMGLTEQDIYINSAILGDELISNPLAWITREMKRITMQGEEQ